MKYFEYGDPKVSALDICVTVASMIIGVGVLNLPRELAKVTKSSDGWISILIAGLLAMIAAFLLAKIAVHFSKQGYFAYTAAAVTKPVAYVITLLLSFYFLSYCSYEIRAIANISKQYLFERTPVEVIALGFFLVVIYAVSGSRAGIIRLNLLTIPFIFGITFVVLSFSLTKLSVVDLKPCFISSITELASGVKASIFSLLGFEVVLLYITMMHKPQLAPKAAAIGVALPIIMSLAIYIVCVGVFSEFALQEVSNPAVELAKEMQIPGEFFERFESIFFTIWIVTVYTTTIMAFDCCIYTLRSMFKKIKHMPAIYMLSPIIFWLSMFPRDVNSFAKMGDYISYLGVGIAVITPMIIYLFAKIRGVKSDAL